MKIFSSDYWGDKGFCPHLNYWGACARAAPKRLRLWVGRTLESTTTKAECILKSGCGVL